MVIEVFVALILIGFNVEHKYLYLNYLFYLYLYDQSILKSLVKWHETKYK